MNRHRRTLLLTGLATVVLGCAPARQASPASAPAPARLTDVVAGTWGWTDGTETCASNPHTLSFSPDRKSMFYRYPRADSAASEDLRYEVRGHGKNSLRVFLVGETRTDGKGALVEWDLILLSNDLYVWRRSDWDPDGSTRPIERCSGPVRTLRTSTLPLGRIHGERA